MSDTAKNTLTKVLKGLVPLAVSVALVVWLFHKVDMRQIAGIVRDGVDWRFILIMMALTVLSHIIRGVRWGIQLRAAGVPRIPWLAESVSIFGAYALNLVIPFCGEAWRCVYISRREGVKLSTIVGTDLGDRGSDGVMILGFLVLMVCVARGAMGRFMARFPLGDKLAHTFSDPTFWLSAAALVLLFALICYLLRKTPFVSGMAQSARRIWTGFAVMFKMKGIGAYLVLTLAIWLCYFLQAYVCFFAFPFTRALVTPELAWGLLPGLVVFVFGSCSMAVPSNGGLGPWNLAVMFALSLYGVSQPDATAWSLVVWGMQTLATIAAGIFAAAYIALSRR